MNLKKKILKFCIFEKYKTNLRKLKNKKKVGKNIFKKI